MPQQPTEQLADSEQQLVQRADVPKPVTAASSRSSSRSRGSPPSRCRASSRGSSRSSSRQGARSPPPHTLPRRRHCTSYENVEQQQACALVSARAELAAARALAAHHERQLSAEAHEVQQLHAQLPAARHQLQDAQARLHAASARLAAARRAQQEAQLSRAYLASLHRQLPRERQAAATMLHRARQALVGWEQHEAAADADLQEAEAVADTWRRRFNRAVVEHRPAARASPQRGGGSCWLARVPFFGGLEATVAAKFPHRSARAQCRRTAA